MGAAWWVDPSSTFESDLVPQAVAATVLQSELTSDPAPAALAHPFPIPPVEAQDRDAVVDQLVRKLSVSTFARAWSDARSRDLDTTVDLVIEALETPEGDDAAQETVEAPVLTPRELAVLELVASGHTNREIAAALFISASTAAVYVSNIRRKLGAKRRVDAAGIAHKMGLLPIR